MPNNFAVFSSRNYDTEWSGFEIGENSKLQAILAPFFQWLNTTPNQVYAGAGTANPDWALTNTRVLIEQTRTARYTNQTNCDIAYKVLRLRLKHDQPTTFQQVFGAGAGAATLTTPLQMLQYQDVEVAQATSAINLLTYKFRNQTWNKPSTFTKMYHVKETRGVLKPGKTLKITLRIKPHVISTAMIGNINAITAALSTPNWYALRELYSATLTQFIPALGLTAGPAVEPASYSLATTATLSVELNTNTKLSVIKANQPFFSYISSGLTANTGAPNVISDMGAAVVVAAHA